MPQLQTQVLIPSPGFSINYHHKILFLGSCFATNIGSKLEKLKFNSITNPFGVIYNPASVAQSIDLLLSNKQFSENDLSFYNDLWFSLYHHTTFSSPDKEKCLENINNTLQAANKITQKADIVFITLGTSWIYRQKSTDRVVSNCHKIPAKEFSHEYLEPAESYRILSEQLENLTSFNPNIKIILTISPIRHWKDGAIENMRSKAALIIAAKELEKQFGNIYYFPVYELFMDEMRDYRYYASDMLHPSEFALEYVWEKFVHTFFTSETQQQISELEKLLSMLQHRPINRESVSFLKFANNLKSLLESLTKKYPSLDFTNETSILNTLLK